MPTWFYGHEPPNAFADRIAKFVQNSVREATLLARCNGGIVFLPGAAGTVQEIFQDACENYYAEPSMIAPMVLVGEQHWTVDLPAWPLLQALAGERTMSSRIALVDTPSRRRRAGCRAPSRVERTTVVRSTLVCASTLDWRRRGHQVG